MKSRASLARLLFALLALAPLSACSSTSSNAGSGAEKANKTVASAEQLSTQLTGLQEAVSTSGARLGAVNDTVATEGLINRKQVATGDIGAAYEGYRESLSQLRSAQKKVESTFAALKSGMQAYVADWEKSMAQVQTEELREASRERREATKARFEKAQKKYEGLWQSFAAHAAKLDEIEIALGSDLTPDGVGSIDDAIEDALDRGKTVQKELGEASKTISEFAEALRSSAPPK